MTELVNSLVQGLLIGGLYALAAAGLSLAFGTMRIINLAHGDLIVVAAYLAFVMAGAAGLPFVAVAVLVPVMMAAAGYALQRGVLNRTVGADVLPPLLVTFGLSIIIQNVLLQIFSADNRKIALGGLETRSIELAPGLSVGVYPLLIALVAVVVIAGLQLLLFRTSIGRAFRATADDAEAARAMGLDTRHVFALTMALALGVAGLAGVLIAAWTSFTPLSGPARLLLAFEVVVIGGQGSLWGVLFGGILLGLAQAVGGYLNPSWQMLAGHLAFLSLLLLRPRGLFDKGPT